MDEVIKTQPNSNHHGQQKMHSKIIKPLIRTFGTFPSGTRPFHLTTTTTIVIIAILGAATVAIRSARAISNARF